MLHFYLPNFAEKYALIDSQAINSFLPLKITRNVEIMGRGCDILSRVDVWLRKSKSQRRILGLLMFVCRLYS